MAQDNFKLDEKMFCNPECDTISIDHLNNCLDLSKSLENILSSGAYCHELQWRDYAHCDQVPPECVVDIASNVADGADSSDFVVNEIQEIERSDASFVLKDNHLNSKCELLLSLGFTPRADYKLFNMVANSQGYLNVFEVKDYSGLRKLLWECLPYLEAHHVK